VSTPVAIVAIVAMFLAFLSVTPEPEVVLHVAPTKFIYELAPPLPDRNPRR
jgi:hypothetical protein